MLSRNRRIKKELVRKILKEGKVVRGTNLSLKYLFIPSKLSAFAFVVPAKVVKGAVSRNKIKRRSRAIIFKNLARIKKGYLALIFFNKISRKIKFSELEKEITELLRKAGFF